MLENFVSSLERLNPANLDDPTSNMEAIQDICLKGQLFIDFPFTNRVNDIKYIKKSGYHSMFYLSSRVSYLSLWLSCFYFLIIEAFSCFELKPSKSKILQNALKEPHWIDAMKKNIQSLHLNKTWVLVPRLVEINVVRSKWVYWIKYKEDSFIVCFKAQLQRYSHKY